MTSPIQVSSVFQYHNSFAAFEASVTIGALVYASLNRNGLWTNAVATGIASISLNGVIFSGSRGALALWLVTMIITIIGLRGFQEGHFYRTRFMLHSFLTVVGTMVGYVLIHKGIVHTNPLCGWLGISLSLLIPMSLSTFICLVKPVRHLLFSRFSKSLWTYISVCVLITVVTIVVKHHALLDKLNTYKIQQLSVSQRFVFWWDGLKIFIRHPLFGYGKGGWNALFMRYQYYPYYSTQSHSFVIDTLIEVGLVGTLALFVTAWPMIRGTFWGYFSSVEFVRSSGRKMSRHAAVVSLSSISFMLLVHSFMDWDMAFLYLQLVFCMGIGAGAGLNARQLSIPNITRKQKPIWLIGVVTLGIFSMGGIYLSSVNIRANALIDKAQSLGDYQMRLSLLQSAESIVPYRADIVQDIAVTEAHTLQTGNVPPSAQTQISRSVLANLEKASDKAQYDYNIASQAATVAYQMGQYDNAYQYALRAFADAPFVSSSVSLAINASTLDGLQSQAHSDRANRAFNNSLALFNEYKTRYRVVQNLPSYLPPERAYILDDFCYDSLAASSLITGHTREAGIFAAQATKSQTKHTVDVGKMIQLIISNHSIASTPVIQFVATHPDVESSFQLLTKFLP
ncbi:O-antigen ligase family protein [Alicyclobacillus dauci]|uniref:O-antigen ligase family protein n=1 Tax=Alicyclobacillus dauci TaxID=1475485 RepID=A0ABY6Z1R5_9BACL|nr:O-antigen ligase family protein [Alicyclobacillus dauci]WAH36837.1 O-antigen ligase family protein [Alicyclobacillus dauci]